ncbi:MAG: phosphatase PAP2 family protein [Dehalococcoidia bacterium]|nr:phosphatase PAP2 family protein [Dehalococcoidia bacterium]
MTSPRPAEVAPRALHLLQWALLAPLALSLATRTWYQHEWMAWLLLAATTAIWAPDLRRGERRWWFFYVAGVFAYTLLRADADGFLFPVQVDYVIRFDETVFRGHEPVVWLQSQFFSPSSIGIFDVIATQVHWSFFVVPHALAAVIYIWRRPLFARYVIMLLAVEYIGLVCFYLVPTAPPWLASQYGQIGPVYRVMEFVGGSVNADTYQTLYSALGEPNSVAAVPSIHMAVTFAAYLWLRRFMPAASPLFLAYSVVMGISLMLLAEHYFFDLLVGVLVAIAVDLAVARLAGPVEAVPAPARVD